MFSPKNQAVNPNKIVKDMRSHLSNLCESLMEDSTIKTKKFTQRVDTHTSGEMNHTSQTPIFLETDGNTHNESALFKQPHSVKAQRKDIIQLEIKSPQNSQVHNNRQTFGENKDQILGSSNDESSTRARLQKLTRQNAPVKKAPTPVQRSRNEQSQLAHS
jgi:hypothetical protein